MRETIRKWYEGRIWVHQFQKIHGEVGSIVVIFDDERDDRYPYTTTWLGENQNESDMAFYSPRRGSARIGTNRPWRFTPRLRSIAWWAPASAAPNTAAS